jgi:hypothetical protein
LKSIKFFFSSVSILFLVGGGGEGVSQKCASPPAKS